VTLVPNLISRVPVNEGVKVRDSVAWVALAQGVVACLVTVPQSHLHQEDYEVEAENNGGVAVEEFAQVAVGAVDKHRGVEILKPRDTFVKQPAHSM